MAWSRRGGRLARTAVLFFRERGSCVTEARYLSTPATSALPATTLPLSPAVRYLVDTNSLDPSLIPASGPHSRLLKGDVLWYMESGRESKTSSESVRKETIPSHPKSTGNAETKFTDIDVDDSHRIRSTSSVTSKVTIPHSSASLQCNVGPILHSLQHTGERDKAMLLLESYLVKAAAATLKQIPESNAVWKEDSLHLHPSVNISVRVSSEGRLLPTPVIIRNADRASVDKISGVLERGRSGSMETVPPPDSPSLIAALLMSYVGRERVCSLVSSSLSHYVELVQSPLSAVLSIAGVQRVFSEEEEEKAGFSETVTVCLSSDSRVLNSDLSSQWLQQFKTNVEILFSTNYYKSS